MSSNRNYLKRGISYLKRNGLQLTALKALERIDRDASEIDYIPYHADSKTIEEQKKRRFDHPYRFSILVPVYETDPLLFRKMLESVGNQTYSNWELILADASFDESRRNIVRDFTEEYNFLVKDYGSIFDKVKYVRINVNRGISENTNIALARATGDYVGLLDHDDVLENTALFDIMSAMEDREKRGMRHDLIEKVMAVYTDEDKISEDGTVYFDLHKKPDFDPVLLCTNNYICHFFVADTNLVKGAGGFRSEYDGAQDHDLILRCTEGLRRDQVLHIPKVLYHWRSTKDSTSENPESKLYAYDAGKRAVSDYFKRAGVDVKVTDSPHLGYYDLDYAYYHHPVRCLTDDDMARRQSVDDIGEEFIMVRSPSLIPCDPNYIADMMSVMQLPHVGAVTGKIIGKGQRVESAGFEVAANKAVKPRFANLKRYYSGYMHGAVLHQLSAAFSPDCVLLRKDAISDLSPKITLKEGFDIYYLPGAEFIRKRK